MRCQNPECSNVITPNVNGGGYVKRYCCPKCCSRHKHLKDYKSKMDKRLSTLVECPTCKNKVKQNRFGSRVFCSRKCSLNYHYHIKSKDENYRAKLNLVNKLRRRKLRKQKRGIRYCANCSNVIPSNYKIYCSDKCRRKEVRKRNNAKQKHKYTLLNEEDKLRMSKIKLKSAIKSRQILSDTYVKNVMKLAGINNPSYEHIELYREQLKLKRLINEKQRNTTNII